MIIQELSDFCGKLIGEFAAEFSDSYIEHTEDSALSSWEITLNLIKIEFRYIKKAGIFKPLSTLYCVIYPQKNRPAFFHIPQLIDYLEIDDFRCYYFPAIESEERMKACFNTLSGFIINNIDKINELSLSDEWYYSRWLEEINRICNVKIESVPTYEPDDDSEFSLSRDFLSSYQVGVYTEYGGYRHFLSGKLKKALKYYDKQGENLLDYEKKLKEFIRSLITEGKSFEAISPECYSSPAARKYKDSPVLPLLAILLPIGCLELILSLVFFVIISVLNYYFDSTTVLCDGIHPIWSLIFAGIPSIFWGIALSDKVQRLLDRKNSAFVELYAPRKTMVLAKVAATVFTLFTILLFVSASQPYIKCYEDTILVRDDSFFAHYESVSYSDIKGIYYTEGRYNDFDEYIDRPSYIFSFGALNADTDGFALTEEQIKNELIPMFDKYKPEMRKIHSERDI